MEEDSKENSEKREPNSRQRRKAAQKNSKKNSFVKRKDVKFRVTFLKSRMFRAKWYEKGSTLVLPENDAKAYSGRSGLKFERLEK